MWANETIDAVTPQFPGADGRGWHVAYTRARHEKRVAEHLAERSVECFLPLYRSARRWNDRSRLIELPLLPGYLFIRAAIRDRLAVLRVPGLVRLLSFQGVPVLMPDAEVRKMRDALDLSIRMEPCPYLRAGLRVRVTRGPLAGLEGYVARTKNIFRVVISLHLLLRSIAVEMDAADVEPIPECAGPHAGAGGSGWAPGSLLTQ